MASRRPLAAVTGATGFLGRRLVPALDAAGWRVRVLVRRPPASMEWGDTDPDVVRGDLADPAALRALAGGADVVVHCAGLIKARGLPDFLAVNAEGSRRVAEATLAAGGRLLMVSSLAARAPALSPYAASKRAGEEIARDLMPDRVTVVRPPAIYGPGDRETFVLFQRAARGGLLPLPVGPEARVALAHVDDVCATIIAALDGAPGVFTVSGAKPEGYVWRSIFEAAARSVGRTPRLISLPRWAFTAAGAASQFVGALQPEPPIYSLGKAREFLHTDWSVGASEQLPGAPSARFDLDGGFAHTVTWYRAQGWLP